MLKAGSDGNLRGWGETVHAMFRLRRLIDFSSLKPSLACKMFYTMISPILTYNSEVWGLFITEIRLQVLGHFTD